ncbi:hypothetical protein [Asticcacaulis sp. AND118]|uniref:hypothetical protein n=1 Tax=Asticcacaulis sp. AND118 TaxID=2840468 RepID=UPI001CFFBAE6|nr:hypothetical protein [Asticcacaulis sp. AND118]UDF04187.1 hypothetical protein LH365_03870 [Asticcacaulis sp. AND118]
MAERVAHGGHHIPDIDIERRFPRSLRNLMLVYRLAVSECRAYLNTGDVPQRLFEQSGDMIIVFDEDVYAANGEQPIDRQV